MNGAPVFKQKSQNQNSFQETVREVSRIFVRYIWNCWMILADGRVTPCWLNFQRRESPPHRPHISIERKGSFPWQDIYTMYIKNCERFPGHGFQVTLRLRLRRSICLCLLVLLINCQKSRMCLRQWQGHLLSCPGQPKSRKKSHKKGDRHIANFLVWFVLTFQILVIFPLQWSSGASFIELLLRALRKTIDCT